MYVKYKMRGPTDYRGNVALIVRAANGDDVSYSNVEALDADMVQLIEEEMDLVKNESGTTDWLPERDIYRKEIDRVADDVRESYKYPGHQSIDMEYSQVELVLRDWQNRGSPTNDVPDEILVWQEVTGNDLAWVVNDIETSIAQHRYLISNIRRERLIGKKELAEAPANEVVAKYKNRRQTLEAMRASEDY